MGAPPVVDGCATTRVASRALKDSIADLIAAGKIELQCSTCLPRSWADHWPDHGQTMARPCPRRAHTPCLGRFQSFSRPFRRAARALAAAGAGRLFAGGGIRASEWAPAFRRGNHKSRAGFCDRASQPRRTSPTAGRADTWNRPSLRKAPASPTGRCRGQ